MTVDYVLGRKLGQGGMAETFEAVRGRARGEGFRVALKQVLPELLSVSDDRSLEFRARFAQEARIGATLEHPNVVQVIDTGTLDGRPYLAMELVEGVSLARLLHVLREEKQESRLPPVVVLHVGCDVATALEYAHRRGVLHRDLTPGNVLVDRTGTCKLADFGIARMLGDDLGLTRTRSFLGKAAYVAPEVFSGPGDARSDLYALGVTLAEVAIGQRVFDASSVVEGLELRRRVDVAEQIRSVRTDLPDRFARLLGRLTSLDPCARPDAEEALDAFESMVGCTTSRAEIELGRLVSTRAMIRDAAGWRPMDAATTRRVGASSAPAHDTIPHKG